VLTGKSSTCSASEMDGVHLACAEVSVSVGDMGTEKSEGTEMYEEDVDGRKCVKDKEDPWDDGGL